MRFFCKRCGTLFDPPTVHIPVRCIKCSGAYVYKDSDVFEVKEDMTVNTYQSGRKEGFNAAIAKAVEIVEKVPLEDNNGSVLKYRIFLALKKEEMK